MLPADIKMCSHCLFSVVVTSLHGTSCYRLVTLRLMMVTDLLQVVRNKMIRACGQLTLLACGQVYMWPVDGHHINNARDNAMSVGSVLMICTRILAEVMKNSIIILQNATLLHVLRIFSCLCAPQMKERQKEDKMDDTTQHKIHCFGRATRKSCVQSKIEAFSFKAHLVPYPEKIVTQNSRGMKCNKYIT